MQVTSLTLLKGILINPGWNIKQTKEIQYLLEIHSYSKNSSIAAYCIVNRMYLDYWDLIMKY